MPTLPKGRFVRGLTEVSNWDRQLAGNPRFLRFMRPPSV